MFLNRKEPSKTFDAFGLLASSVCFKQPALHRTHFGKLLDTSTTRALDTAQSQHSNGFRRAKPAPRPRLSRIWLSQRPQVVVDPEAKSGHKVISTL